MTIAEELLAELKAAAQPLTREFVFERIERDYGKGFARVVREQFEQQRLKQLRK